MKIKILTLTDSPTCATYEWFSTRRFPCFSNALSCHSAQIRRSKFAKCRRTDRHDSPKREWVDETIRVGRIERSVHSPRTRPQAYHGLLRRGSGTHCHRIRSPSVRAAKEAWQNASGKEASELTFRRFLSTLAQDIDV